jgi:Ig domain of plant-specific actin-binding protein
MKPPRSMTRRQVSVALVAMSLLGIAAFAGSGSAQSQGIPTNTSEPRITGTPVVNSTLAVNKGSWTESPTSFEFQWTRCPSSGGAPDASNCAAISGATTSKYIPGNIDVGKRLRARVTAVNEDGAKTVATNASAAVKRAGTLANTKPPTISGEATVGSTLTANRGQWSGSDPIAYSYSWRRCDGDGGNCAAIGGEIETTYTLTTVDQGHSFRIRVVARDDSGSSSATSVPTAVVRATAPPVTNGCAKTGGTVPVTGVSPPARLTIDQTQVSPSTITFGTRAVTARFHVSACGGSVEGALVYVTAVPYGQFAIPNEQATASDGWVTLQFSALRGYPVSSKQQLLVMFVRARKSGESLLGGISTRRLVSFRVTRG